MHEIAKLTLENFQGHAKSVIEPGGPGTLTVITGATDAGKSSIFRGLRWLYHNTPSGDGFRRIGTDYMAVTEETVEGHAVTRRRTATTNRYIVDGQVLEGFGNSVPLEVQEVTGVRPLRLADQELRVNLAHQKDPDFLGAGISGPARAKALGILGGTEIVDRASRDLGTDLYRWREEIKRLEADLDTTRRKLLEYEHLPKLEETLQALQRIHATVKEEETRLTTLVSAQQALATIHLQQAAVEERLGRLEGVPEAARLVAHVQMQHARLTRLQGLRSQLRDIESQAAAATETLERTRNVEEAAAHCTAFTHAANRANMLRQARLRYLVLLEAVTDVAVTLARAEGLDQAARHYASAAEAQARLTKLQRIRADLATVTDQEDQVTLRFHRIVWAIAGAEAELKQVQIERLRRLRLLGSELLATTKQIDRTEAEITGYSSQLAVLRANYTKTLLEAGKCPTCGQAVDPEHFHPEEVV